MSTYSKGVLDSGTGVGTDFLWQSRSHEVQSDIATAAENQGNTAAETFFNHRLVVKISAKIPSAAGLPIPGQTVLLTGITMPTVTPGTPPAPNVVSGTFGPGSGSDNFFVESPVEVGESNNDYNTVSLSLIKYLNNDLPAAPT